MRSEAGLLVRDLGLGELRTGMSVYYRTRLGRREVDAYASLIGDVNPLHVDHDHGRGTPPGARVVHGMLMASHFSTIIGVLLPGRRALLTKMHVEFLHPVRVGSRVVVSGKIVHIERLVGSVDLSLRLYVKDRVCVTARAAALVQDDARGAFARVAGG